MRTTFIAFLLISFNWLNPGHAFGQSDSLIIESDSVVIQLDSVFVDAEAISVTDPADSSYTYQVARLTLHFDHIEDLGLLTIVAYDTLSGAPIGEFIRSRQELIDEGLLVADHVTWSLFTMIPGFTYRIEVTPQNLAGAYTRIGSVILSNPSF
jgi:hypothetical protein